MDMELFNAALGFVEIQDFSFGFKWWKIIFEKNIPQPDN